MEAHLQRLFLKKFQKLPRAIQKKFGERLELFLAHPYDPVLRNHSVDKVFPDCRSINVTGDYRAIYKIEENIAIFITIGTHSELY